MNFRILKEFPEIFNRIKDFRKDKDVNSVWAYCGPRPCGNGLAQRPKWPGWLETSAWRGRTPDVVNARRGEGWQRDRWRETGSGVSSPVD
jgi:hypothetical protein